MGNHGHSNAPAQPTIPANHSWQKLPKMGMGVGAVGLGLSVVLAFVSGKDQFYYSYLVAYLFFLSISLGGLFFVLVHHATKSGWAVAMRRIAENIMGTLPLMAVLFLPVLAGLHQHVLFHHWTEMGADDAILQGKSAYLNVPFFYVRAVIFFAAWALLSRFFRGTSIKQDTTGDHSLSERMLRKSYPGLAVFVFSISFASWDWIMTHDPHWYSTMYGVYYFAGTGLSIYAVLAMMVIIMPRKGLLADTFTIEHQHALGKLTWGFTVFWAYIAFSQFMLIWYANIPEETLWFKHRVTGSWETVTILLAIGHFVLPFFFLIARTMKRIPNALLACCIWLMAMHYVDLHWQIMPVLHNHDAHPALLDLTTFIGVGGIWVGYFMKLMTSGNMIPIKDPRLSESLSFENM
ncbi:MAG: hypothetical protein ACI9WU_001673 [Myxococcota bacterium]|jgi:hypothetical protein